RILPDRPGQFGIDSDGASHLGAAAVFITTRAGNAVEPGKVAQVLHAAHLVVEQRRVRHISDVAAGSFRSLAENGNLAARGLRQAGQRAQQGGLAGAVVAENGVEASRVKFGGHAAQRGKASELLDDVVDGNGLDGGIGHRRWAISPALSLLEARNPCTAQATAGSSTAVRPPQSEGRTSARNDSVTILCKAP